MRKPSLPNRRSGREWHELGALGLLSIVISLCSPSGELFETILSLLTKNELLLDAQQVSELRAIIAIPLYLAAVFGLLRDAWSGAGQGDRRLMLACSLLTALLYLAFIATPISYPILIAASLATRISFRLVSTAFNGMVATFATQNAATGRTSAVWSIADALVVVVGYLLGGYLAETLATLPAPSSFYALFVLGALACAIVFWACLRLRPIFTYVRDERSPADSLLRNLRRLSRHRPLYPALAISLLWNFAPGADTPLLFYLQNTLHGSNFDWGLWNALFNASFIPTYALFGALLRYVSLRRLLWVGTLVAIPQMLPLLFIHTTTAALAMAVPIGLMGGIATAAYLDLLMRSSPRALQATTLMMALALEVISSRLGDLLGTYLYDRHGGFTACVAATTAVYALLLLLLPLIPAETVASHDRPIPVA